MGYDHQLWADIELTSLILMIQPMQSERAYIVSDPPVKGGNYVQTVQNRRAYNYSCGLSIVKITICPYSTEKMSISWSDRSGLQLD